MIGLKNSHTDWSKTTKQAMLVLCKRKLIIIIFDHNFMTVISQLISLEV